MRWLNALTRRTTIPDLKYTSNTLPFELIQKSITVDVSPFEQGLGTATCFTCLYELNYLAVGTDHGRIMLFDLKEAVDVQSCKNAGFVCLQLVLRPPFNRIDAVSQMQMVLRGPRTLHLHVIYKSGCYQLVRIIRQSQPSGSTAVMAKRSMGMQLQSGPGSNSVEAGGSGASTIIGDMAAHLWQTLKNAKSDFADDSLTDTDLMLWQRPSCCTLCSCLTVIDGLASSAYGVTKAVVDLWTDRSENVIILKDRAGWLYSIRPSSQQDLVPKPVGLLAEVPSNARYQPGGAVGSLLKWVTNSQLIVARVSNGVAQRTYDLRQIDEQLPSCSVAISAETLRIAQEAGCARMSTIRANDNSPAGGGAIAPPVATCSSGNKGAVEMLTGNYLIVRGANIYLVTTPCVNRGQQFLKLKVHLKIDLAEVLGVAGGSALPVVLHAVGRDWCCILQLGESQYFLLDLNPNSEAPDPLSPALHPNYVSFVIWLLPLPHQLFCQKNISIDSSAESADLAGVVSISQSDKRILVNVFNGWSNVLATSVEELMTDFHQGAAVTGQRHQTGNLAEMYRTTRWILMCSRNNVPLFGHLPGLKRLSSLMILNIWIQNLEILCNQPLTDPLRHSEGGEDSGTGTQNIEEERMEEISSMNLIQAVRDKAKNSFYIDDPNLLTKILEADEEEADLSCSPRRSPTDQHPPNPSWGRISFIERLVAYVSILVDMICYTDNAQIIGEILSSRLLNRGLLIQSIFAIQVESKILTQAERILASGSEIHGDGESQLTDAQLVRRLIEFLPQPLVYVYYNLANEHLEIEPRVATPRITITRNDSESQLIESAIIDQAHTGDTPLDLAAKADCTLCRFRCPQKPLALFSGIVFRGKAACATCVQRTALVFTVLSKFDKFQILVAPALPPRWPLNFLHPLLADRITMNHILFWTDLALKLKDEYVIENVGQRVVERKLSLIDDLMGEAPVEHMSLVDADDISIIHSPDLLELPMPAQSNSQRTLANRFDSEGSPVKFVRSSGHAKFWLRLCELEAYLQLPENVRGTTPLLLSAVGNKDRIPICPLVLFGVMEKWITSLSTDADIVDIENCITKCSDNLLNDLTLTSPLLLMRCVILPLIRMAKGMTSAAPQIATILSHVCDCLERLLGSFAQERWTEVLILQLVRFSVLANMIAEDLHNAEDVSDLQALVESMLSSREDVLNHIKSQNADTEESLLASQLILYWDGFNQRIYETALLKIIDYHTKVVEASRQASVKPDEDCGADDCLGFTAESVTRAASVGYRKAATLIAQLLGLHERSFALMTSDEIYLYVSQYPSVCCCDAALSISTTCCVKAEQFYIMQRAFWQWGARQKSSLLESEGGDDRVGGRLLQFIGLAVRLILDHDSHDSARVLSLSLELLDTFLDDAGGKSTRAEVCAVNLLWLMFLWRSLENPEVDDAFARCSLSDGRNALEYASAVHESITATACPSISLNATVKQSSSDAFLWRMCAAHLLRERIATLVILHSPTESIIEHRPPTSTGVSPLSDRNGIKPMLDCSISHSHLYLPGLEDTLPGANIHDNRITPRLLINIVRLSNTLLRVPLLAFDPDQLTQPKSIHNLLLKLAIAQWRGDVGYVANFLSDCVPHVYSHPDLAQPHLIPYHAGDLWESSDSNQQQNFIIAVLAGMPEACLPALLALHKKYGTTQSWFSQIYESIENVAGCRLKIPYTPETSSAALRKALVDFRLASCQSRILEACSGDRDEVENDAGQAEGNAVFINSSAIMHGECSACAETLKIDGHTLTAKSVGEFKWLEVRRALNIVEIDSSGHAWHRDCHGADMRWVMPPATPNVGGG